ncbi:pyridoxamine 5'-phosphate oxidase family protein [Blastococcus sp. CT_GayMR16]|uniref:pyridoxamine 5'-phosphate oxidase family protein n=1 Tax=Blastococcus sp. CT_GayMR16 TaxID=2559607 RepID=UPI001074065A|nr:pyridoxamine 5'-phosphate oxidase family protein [Blastococcus sp. CT_GayMR16]TFV88809.1 pyridoxamine 5'-phosphate oxidase family protein [Blastococcus sp. CT_GayMR16]
MEDTGQRRGRSIAMTAAEVDDFLTGERTCRVATVGGDGSPHVAPLWFVWDGAALWLNSLVRSQRWTDLQRDPRVSVVVDAGTEFAELRGVEISGRAVVVGDVPRTAEPDPALARPEELFAGKYAGGASFAPDGRHAWLRITPDKRVSWDFRKNPALRMAGPPSGDS